MARETLKAGTTSKIGNRKNIKIWEDNWLPWILKCKLSRTLVEYVSQLVDNNRHWWREDLVEAIFYEIAAQFVKQLPLGNLNS